MRRSTSGCPSWFAESAYTAGLWTKAAIDSINGNVEDREAFLKAMRTVQVKAPRGPLKLDAYDNPIQNIYIGKVEKVKHPVLGDVLMNRPIKTYEAVSQFWTWTARGVPRARSLQALMLDRMSTGRPSRPVSSTSLP
jgi:branched-chain amino acid transport system substrate-binding protein